LTAGGECSNVRVPYSRVPRMMSAKTMSTKGALAETGRPGHQSFRWPVEISQIRVSWKYEKKGVSYECTETPARHGDHDARLVSGNGRCDILHSSVSVDWDTTFRLAIILGIVLPLTRTRGGEPPA
jgi:hypothetical protein